MGRGAVGVVAVLALIPITGCGTVVDGSAMPAAKAVHVLPTDAEITAAVGNGLSSFDFKAFVGGPEILPDGFRTDADASPVACIGVTDTTTRVTYESTPMIEAARQSYFTLAPGAGVSGADAAVVRMTSAQAARQVFEGFVARWRDCDGTTVVKRLNDNAAEDVDATVGDVVSDGALLSASLSTHSGSSTTTSSYERAVGVRGDTLVEVSLATAEAGDSDGRARALAQAMLNKV